MTRCFTAKQTIGKLDEWLQAHPKAVVVELGSYEGGSAVQMLRRHPGIRLYCIDTWEPVTWDKTPPRDVLGAFFNATDQYRERCIGIRDDTRIGMSALRFNNVMADLVYVDADHSPEAVYADVTMALTCWPEAHLIGDDAETPGLIAAVTKAAVNHGRKIEHMGPVWWLA